MACVDLLVNNAGINWNLGWKKCLEVWPLYYYFFVWLEDLLGAFFNCSAQISVLKRKMLFNQRDLLYIENFMEQNLWLAAHRFSFWYWKLGGTVKKTTLHLCIFTYQWDSKTWDAIKTFFSGVKHLDRHLCTDVESFIPRLVCSTLKTFSRLVWSSPQGERSTGCPAWLLRDRWLPLQFIELVIVSRFDRFYERSINFLSRFILEEQTKPAIQR